MSQVLEFLTPTNGIDIAEEIIYRLTEEATPENMHCEYDVSHGRVVGSSANTWFVFDTVDGEIIDEFKTNIFSFNLTDEEKEAVNKFKNDIIQYIKDTGIDAIRGKIREVLIPDSDPDMMPLHEIRITDVEIVDYSSVPFYHRFLIKLKKIQGTNIDTEAVIRMLADYQEDTGEKDMDKAFKALKDKPEFEGVLGVVQGEKFLNDVSIAIFVDYSFSETILEAIQSN